MGSHGDGYIHAFDKDTGTILWETAIEGTPDGIPAVYEVDGREYVAFFAAGGGGDGIIVKKTKPEVERYNFSIHAKKRNTAEPVSALSLAPFPESIQ